MWSLINIYVLCFGFAALFEIAFLHIARYIVDIQQEHKNIFRVTEITLGAQFFHFSHIFVSDSDYNQAGIDLCARIHKINVFFNVIKCRYSNRKLGKYWKKQTHKRRNDCSCHVYKSFLWESNTSIMIFTLHHKEHRFMGFLPFHFRIHTKKGIISFHNRKLKYRSLMTSFARWLALQIQSQRAAKCFLELNNLLLEK